MPNSELNTNIVPSRLTSQQAEDIAGLIISMDAPEEVKNEMIARLRAGDMTVVNDIMSAAQGYPETPIVFGADVKFKLGVIASIKRFKKKKTHNKTAAQRLQAMREMAADLSAVYNVDEAKVAAVCMVHDETADSRGSFYHRKTKTIVMVEKLSIITFLHEFAHHLGKDERGATRWSLTLFKRIWPDQFERLVPEGHTMVVPQGEVEGPEDDAPAVPTAAADVETADEPEQHVPTDEEEEVLALIEQQEEEELEEDLDGADDWIDEDFEDDAEDDDEEPVKPKPRRRKKTTTARKPKKRR